MKRFLYLMLPLFFIACEKESESQESEIRLKSTTTLNPTDFDYIGERHNDVLQSIYDSLVASRTTTTIQQALAVSNHVTTTEINRVTPLTVDGQHHIDRRMDLVEAYFLGQNNHLPNPSLYHSSAGLSKPLASLLDDLNVVFTDIERNQNMRLSDAISQIEGLERKAVKNLTKTEDQFVFFVYSRIAIHSLTYWHNNLDNWVIAFSGTKKVSGPFGISWGNAAKSDVVSAGVGALHLAVSGTGAAMLAGGPAGWVGIGAVVVAEGIIGSAGSILVDLW